ncbi:thioesterase family protein [Halalkalibacterium halodurans]|jgi:acyl-CoA thioester hydrolase|uniref:BH3090 protein n=2 Tax=Halalkalibacterium halodurans TaxID=86665 RepID=Q9K8B6_HALH5|nr:thioesterase family protein [Halalkalibacterium halodurans]MDY7223630.1 thioesterase family protein [Halalkalibacterium halodurans]MDY7242851.1 thioesterase family protein [Halalkalibacterium halodurans]MED4082073.1 thioesterase family protein [Halalkalibacterium halodurans]MED4084349.1 thioesterase family protein [Halalkalibacterium halodurans]MED4103658.1 thioesterase family protein [Halalkalibacterium halodurans]
MRLPAYIEQLDLWEAEFRFSTSVKVRFSETDAFGHLNNTKTFVYFEEARTDFFKSLGFFKLWTNPEYEGMIVVADLQCDYQRQVFFDDRLTVWVKPANIGSSSVDLHYMIKNSTGHICMTGRGTVVQVSKKTGKPFPLSEEMKDSLLNAKGAN